VHHFEATLVPGGKAPYTTWTFLVIPSEIAEAWGPGRHAVRGTLAGIPFRGTVSRGEGVLRMPVPGQLRDQAGVSNGDQVAVSIERDPEPRPVEIPDELRAVLDTDPELAQLFDALPPAHRRAWAGHVGEAKRPETRVRRAARASAGIRARSFPGDARS
jgi:hypothetical protein